MLKLAEVRKSATLYLTQPVLKLLIPTRITPNALSLTGFLITLFASALILMDKFPAAGLVVLLAGFFDMLDGALARLTNQVSAFGAVLDSTLDRLAEAALLLSILLFYARESSQLGIVITGVALVSSLLVSYVRARAEGMSLDCKVGILTRSERVIILSLGLLLSSIDRLLIISLILIALLSLITVIQRLLHIWRLTKSG